MYCQDCGEMNSDDSLFCESCGAKLVKDEILKPNIQQKEFTYLMKYNGKIPQLYKILIFEIIIFLIIFFSFISICERVFSPEHVAERYFVNMVNSNFPEAYKELDMTETEFTNIRMFMQAYADSPFEIVKDYSVHMTLEEPYRFGLFDKMEQREEAKVKISYSFEGSNSEKIYDISLNKQKSKFILFENWKIDTENLICQNYSIYVPNGAGVTLDGIILDATYLCTEDNYNNSNVLDHYIIPEMFYGKHHINVVMEDMVEINEDVIISNQNIQYYLQNMQLTEETVSELIQIAARNMEQIYKAALEGKEVSEIINLFVSDEDCRNNIESNYQNLVSYFNDNPNCLIKKISFTELKGSAVTNAASVRISFKYGIDYSGLNSWTGDWKEYNHEGYETCDFYFRKENGRWLFQNWGCIALIY